MTSERRYSTFLAWLHDIAYKNWVFKIGREAPGGHEGRGGLYLQVYNPDGTDNMSEGHLAWKGRKWRLSRWVSKSEFVQTCLKAVLTTEEHEAREHFRYKSRAIYGPHIGCEELHAICRRTDERWDQRPLDEAG